MKNNLRTVFYTILPAILLATSSCNHPQPEIRPVPENVAPETKTIKVDLKTLATDIDPECKMSLKDGVGDTATVNGKLYGFCSEGCKNSFIAENTVKDTLKK